MARHIFLTGEKQVGKSTLLNKALACYGGDVGGFRTVRTNAFLENQYSVHLFCMGEAGIPDEKNLLFVCGQPDAHISERFDRLGCEALNKCSGSSLIVMDELGPHEAEASLFHDMVLSLLDGDVPVLGVLQAPAGSFWQEIVKHSETEILEITKENRALKDLLEYIVSTLTAASSAG